MLNSKHSIQREKCILKLFSKAVGINENQHLQSKIVIQMIIYVAVGYIEHKLLHSNPSTWSEIYGKESAKMCGLCQNHTMDVPFTSWQSFHLLYKMSGRWIPHQIPPKTGQSPTYGNIPRALSLELVHKAAFHLFSLFEKYTIYRENIKLQTQTMAIVISNWLCESMPNTLGKTSQLLCIWHPCRIDGWYTKLPK